MFTANINMKRSVTSLRHFLNYLTTQIYHKGRKEEIKKERKRRNENREELTMMNVSGSTPSARMTIKAMAIKIQYDWVINREFYREFHVLTNLRICIISKTSLWMNNQSTRFRRGRFVSIQVLTRWSISWYVIVCLDVKVVSTSFTDGCMVINLLTLATHRNFKPQRRSEFNRSFRNF